MTLIGRCKKRQLNVQASNTVENIFLANLAIADFLMGLYLLAIAIADAWFGPQYFRYSQKWRTGPMCGIISVFGVLSSIVSILDLTIMTIDRFLCIVFPYGKIHFDRKWGKITCALIWAFGLVFAILPLFLSESIQNLYGYTDVCLGLPIVAIPQNVYQTSQIQGNMKFMKGFAFEATSTWVLSLVLYTYLSSICLFIVTICYVGMFISLKNSTRSTHRVNGSNDDFKIVRRMSIIVGTDMLCWLPLIILSVLSQCNVKIPIKVNPWLVIFVLPINSALNPFIYSYSVLRSKEKNVYSFTETNVSVM